MPDTEMLWILATWAMLVVGLAWWPCGGCGDCTFGEDDFNRSSLGAGWTEVSGSWSIVGNEVSTSNSNGVLLFETASSGPQMQVEAQFDVPTSGDAVRVIVAYTDANKYLFVEASLANDGFTYTMSPLRLYSRSGGVNTLLETLSGVSAGLFGNPVTVRLCYNGDLLRGSIGTAYVIEAGVAGFTGTKAGIGTGTIAGTITADNFLASKTTEALSKCQPCSCSCAYCSGVGTVDPCEIEVTISSVGDDACGTCEDLNATYVLTRRYVVASGDALSCQWFIAIAACNYTLLTASIAAGGAIQVTAANVANTKFILWADTVATDCHNWSALDVPYDSQSVAPNNECDASSSTCEVTAA